jgi:hypothetical protein
MLNFMHMSSITDELKLLLPAAARHPAVVVPAQFVALEGYASLPANVCGIISTMFDLEFTELADQGQKCSDPV